MQGSDRVQLDMPIIDLILLIEKALRQTIVVWEEEEYRDIAERIARIIAEESNVRI